MEKSNFVDQPTLRKHVDSECYFFADEVYNSVFYNELIIPVDKTSYGLNSLFYRSPEFNKNNDILIGGCSFTFGTGLPENKIWSTIVSKHFEKTYSNISLNGISTTAIVDNVMAYFAKYGHPKVVMCLFPDFYRMRIPTNPNIFITENNMKNLELKLSKEHYDYNQYYQNIHLSGVSHRPKYSVKPYIAETVLPSDMAYLSAVKSIRHLEQYCKAANIIFVWSVWELKASEVLNIVKNENTFSNIIDIEPEKWHRNKDLEVDSYHKEVCECSGFDKCKKSIECHQDLKNSNPEIFHYAADRDNGIGLAHWGTHRHQHIADKFIDKLKDIGYY